MNIKVNNLTDLYERGIYKIENLITGKIYIGSVSSSKSCFNVRWKQHLNDLKIKKHFNQHLQNSFNIYQEDNFQFSILEILNENILDREQFYLDNFKGDLYNINFSATKPPCYSTSSKETRNKQVTSRKRFNKKAYSYYYKVKNKEILLKDIPVKYKLFVESRLNMKRWNKGLTKETYDFSFLKNVKKTLSPAFLERATNVGLRKRKRSKPINVYLFNGKYFNTFRSVADIIDYSKQNNNNLIIIKNPKTKDLILECNNILKVLKLKQPHHKGLIFRYNDTTEPILPLKPSQIKYGLNEKSQIEFYKNSCLVAKTTMEKFGELLGNLDADNQQPS